MSNWKVNRIVPNEPSEKPYIKGTERPNYYLVLGEGDDYIYGFRPLAVAVPPIGSQPTTGVSTRIRVVPKDAAKYASFKDVLAVIGFEKRDYGDGFVHFSTVTSDPLALISKLKVLLELSPCFGTASTQR